MRQESSFEFYPLLTLRHVWLKSYSTVKVSSCVPGIITPCRLYRNQTFHLRSFDTTASGRSPHKESSVPAYTGNFSEKWACELCSSPLDSGLYINSWEDRSSSEHCHLFVFSSFFFHVSLKRTSRQKHYSCPRWISCAVLSVCISLSLVQPLNRLTVLPCCLSKSSLYSHLPPFCSDGLYTGCSISRGLYLLNDITQAVS